jgi:DNA-binding protein HU-beta
LKVGLGRRLEGRAEDGIVREPIVSGPEHAMNKGQLIDRVAEELGGSRAMAERAVKAVLGSISSGVKQDGSVAITGFGTFSRKERRSRRGCNPQTGESMEIPASTTVGFKPANLLKKVCA